MVAANLTHHANIGPKGRRSRLLSGLVLAASGLAVVVTDLAAGSRWWLVAVFALIWGGALGVLQALGGT
jgi:fatty acid desaturase